MICTQSYAADNDQLTVVSLVPVANGTGAGPVSRYETQITGIVKDDEGMLLPGVTVLLKGTSIGTSTNTDGSFSLSVPDEQSNGTLVFSFIGFATQEIAIGGQRVINVTMATDAKALEEVVVTRYGTQRKSDVTGSVGVVSSEELLKAPVTNDLQGLQGKIAGVNVKLNSGSPTSSSRVVIKGVGTINSSSSPLYALLIYLNFPFNNLKM